MSSYKNIIKTSGLIAIVKVFEIVFRLIRNKFIAVILGTKGFGIWSLYQTYINAVTTFSAFGLDQSGVREISKNVDDHVYTAKTIYVFRKAMLLTSSFTSLLSMIFSKEISQSLFNSSEYYLGIIIISFVIFFNTISNGQKSVLIGLRNLKYLAVSQILAAVIGSIATVLLIVIMGLYGIPFGVFCIGLVSLVSTWYFVKKLDIPKTKPQKNEFIQTLKPLLRLGFGFSIAGLFATLSIYLTRVFLSHHFSLEAVGIYQASWTISNMYIGIILTAIGVDFMPRLMGVIDDKEKVARLVNEQMELGLLVSSLAVVFIILFSPFILNIFFSENFIGGTEIIRWQVLGVGMRVLGFPLGHAIMAKNKPLLYLIVQAIFWFSDYLILVIISINYGFSSLGINYFISYTIYLILAWLICYKIINFTPSSLLMKTIFICSSFIGISWITYVFDSIYIDLLVFILLLSIVNIILKKDMQISFWDLLKQKLLNK